MMIVTLGTLERLQELVRELEKDAIRRQHQTIGEIHEILGAMYRAEEQRQVKISASTTAKREAQNAERMFLFTQRGGDSEIVKGFDQAAKKAGLKPASFYVALSKGKGAFGRRVGDIFTEVIDLNKWPDGALPLDHFKKKYKPIDTEQDAWTKRKAEQDFLRD